MKRRKESCIENRGAHIQLPIGAMFTGFCPQNDRSICLNILFYYVTLST